MMAEIAFYDALLAAPTGPASPLDSACAFVINR